MKKIILLLSLSLLLSTVVYAEKIFPNCPVESDEEMEIQQIIGQGLFDYLKNPEESSITQDELKDVIDFYFGSDSCYNKGSRTKADYIAILNKIRKVGFLNFQQGTTCALKNTVVPNGTWHREFICIDGLMHPDCTNESASCPAGTLCNATSGRCYQEESYLYSCANSTIEPNYYILQNDVQANESTCFTLGADHTVLDLNGFTIHTEEGAHAVQVNAQKVTIKNGGISGFSSAISVQGSQNVVDGVTVEQSSNGLAVDINGNFNMVSSVTAEQGSGVRVTGNRNAISGLVASGNKIIGNNNWIKDSTIDGKNIAGSKGIYLTGTGNNVTDNTISKHKAAGIHVFSSSKGYIKDNIFSSNYDGIYLQNSEHTIVTDNTIGSSSSKAIYLRSTKSAAVNRNTINGGVHSIRLSHSDSNAMKHNTIIGSSYGPYLYRSDSNRVYYNDITNVKNYGTYVKYSYRNYLFANDIINSKKEGIYLSRSHKNTLSSNDVENSKSYGIRLSSSDSNKMRYNDVIKAKKSGYRLYDSDKNLLWRNDAVEGNSYGFYIYNSDKNKLSFDIAKRNKGRGFYLSSSSSSSYKVSKYNDLNRIRSYDNKYYGIFLRYHKYTKLRNTVSCGNKVADLACAHKPSTFSDNTAEKSSSAYGGCKKSVSKCSDVEYFYGRN